MLRRLNVDNYKCLVGLDVQFEEFNLLIGDNGSGKSAVLDVLFAVRELLRGGSKLTDPDVFPASTLTRWQPDRRQTVEIEVERPHKIFQALIVRDSDEPYEIAQRDAETSEMLRYRLEIEHDVDRDRARLRSETLHADDTPLFGFEDGNVQLFRDDGSRGPAYTADWSESALARVVHGEANQRLGGFVDFVSRMTLLSLKPASVRANSERDDDNLTRSAANFVDWYRHIVQEHPKLVAPYEEVLRGAISGFAGIRLEKSGTKTRDCMVDIDAAHGRYSVRLDELSDGQRALVVLYGLLLLGAQQPRLLVIDEPENFLALTEIQPWLNLMEESCGSAQLQAVLCSHHPHFIDLVSSYAGLVLRRDDDGKTGCMRPTPEMFESGITYSELIARGWDV